MDIITYLTNKAKKIRQETIHLSVEYNNGHIASALSCVEILTVLYKKVMEKEDRFILSKGHGALSFYAVLREKGFNPTISGHPDIEREQGVECTTGSLGHGVGIAVGMALSKKLKKENGRIYVLLGDGECQEGVVWETLNIIRRHRLDNIVLIIDNNSLQALDTIGSILAETNLVGKFAAFGCETVEVDGHNIPELLNCFNRITENKQTGTPSTYAIIAHTVKGKGIHFMENVPGWHSRMLEGDLLEEALRELQ